MKKISTLVVMFLAAFVVLPNVTHASSGGLVSTMITGPHEITVTYTHTLDYNDASSYSNLGLDLKGRSIIGASENIASNHIKLLIDGPALPANAQGTINIDNTVTWADAEGGFDARENTPVGDGQGPELEVVTLGDTDSSGGVTGGDTYAFRFNEPMATSTITTSNIDTVLGLPDGGTFGTTGQGLALSWNAARTVLTVTLGSDMHILNGDMVYLEAYATDIVGNPANSQGPLTLPTIATVSRTLYFYAQESTDWTDVNNWWVDSEHTVQASSIPTAYDDVVIDSLLAYPPIDLTVYVRSMVVNNTGILSLRVSTTNGVVFNGQSGIAYGAAIMGDVIVNDMSALGIGMSGPEGFFSGSYVTGSVTFNAPTTANYGTIYGTTTFHGQYGNAGLIYGNVEFNDYTSNPGIIFGHVIFRDYSFNQGFGESYGAIHGNVDVYYPSHNPIDGTIDGEVTYYGYDNPFTEGDGSEEHPYVISSCGDLQNMTFDLSAHYFLGQDIDCSSSATWNANSDEWVDGQVDGTLIPDSYASTTHTDIIVPNNGYYGFIPVGNNDTGAFTGSFDGNGHTISNLWIFRKATTSVGIFGETDGAIIQNVTLASSSIVGGHNTGGIAGSVTNGTSTDITLENNTVRTYLQYNGGGFAGYVNGGFMANITNLSGAVHGSGNTMGGLIGYFENGTMDDSWSRVPVDGGTEIGGLIGHMDAGTITNSHASGDVTANKSEWIVMKTGYYAGGFIGSMNTGTIINAYATGHVYTSSNVGGGFVGRAGPGSVIQRSYASGDVSEVIELMGSTPTIAHEIGGFVGNAFGATISDSYATGNVTTTGDYVGGFVGHGQCESIFTNDYATGNVTGHDNVGGFVGTDECEGPASQFQKTSASGSVTGHGNVGGFAGSLYNDTVANAYASGNVSGTSIVAGFAGVQNYGGGIQNSYARGFVSADDASSTAGFVTIVDGQGEIANSFWDTETTGQASSSAGTPKTTAEMTSSNSIYADAGWDLANTWFRSSPVNSGYPIFTYLVTPTVMNVSPANGTDHIGTSSPIIINFSVPMDTESFGVSSSPCADDCPEYTLEWSNDNQTVTLTKIGNKFAYATTYTVDITSGHSANGDYDIEELPYSWTFTTEATPTPQVVVPAQATPIRVGPIFGGSGGGYSSSYTSAIFQNKIDTIQLPWNPTSTTTEEKVVGVAMTQKKSVGNDAIKKVLKDLSMGMTSANVKILQDFLIAQNSGPSALALKKHGVTTTYFGKLTKAALVEWQKAHGILPATGTFGPKTRGKVKGA